MICGSSLFYISNHLCFCLILPEGYCLMVYKKAKKIRNLHKYLPENVWDYFKNCGTGDMKAATEISVTIDIIPKNSRPIESKLVFHDLVSLLGFDISSWALYDKFKFYDLW